jgi:hypothetical protein
MTAHTPPTPPAAKDRRPDSVDFVTATASPLSSSFEGTFPLIVAAVVESDDVEDDEGAMVAWLLPAPGLGEDLMFDSEV